MADTQRKNNPKEKNDKAVLSDKILQITQAQLDILIETMIKKAMRPMQLKLTSLSLSL